MLGALRVLTLGFLPLAAHAADARSCWLRDAVTPAQNVTYALCQQGDVLVTNDGGAKWNTNATGATGLLRAIAFLNANRGFVVGDGGTVLMTEDGAKTWKKIDSGTTENLLAIQMVGETAWVSGFDGVLLHSTDGGRTWSKQNSGVTQALESLCFADADHGWAAGWAGTILLTTDGGKTWRQIHCDAASWSLSSVYFRNLSEGWIAGFGGQLLRTTDGGATWTPVKTGVNGWHTSVRMDGAGRVWVTADNRLLLLSEDNGNHWRQVGVDNTIFVNRLVGAGNALMVLGPFGMMRQQSSGVDWKRVENPFVGDSDTK